MTAKKKGKTTKIILGGIVVLAILGGIYAEMSKTTPVRTARAATGTIKQYVEERARTTLPHVYHLTMPEQGRVNAITLDAGTVVTQGQIVATLDKADLADAKTESDEMVEAMMNAYNASLAQIKAAQARQDYAKWLWEAQKELYEKAQTSEMEEKKAQKAFLESQVDLESDQSTAYAMKALYAVSKLFPIYINRRLDRADIESPVNGIILKRHVWNRKVLQPGDSLIDIGNLDQLEVTADILTEQAVEIQPGDTVEIYGETIGTKPIRGTVKRVKPQGFTKLSSLGVEQQRVPVIIALNEDDLTDLNKNGRTLGLEYRVHVRIYTATQDNAVIIPRTTLFRGNDGTWQAYVVRGEKTELVKLELGLVNDKQAEVLKGLQAGDQVVVAPEATLQAGVRVSCTPAL
jgi:HlyD family secretion protein